MTKWIVIAALLCLAVFGINPFAKTLDPEASLIEENGTYATETKRLPDGTYMVATLTPMPGASADMVRWWFSDFLQTTEHYKWWHPQDHVWMDWENKKPGEIVGASHLVHEYIGEDLHKLRIHFVDPVEFYGRDPNDVNTFALCARTGLLDQPINVGRMCHVVRNTADGAEMRSRFWMGHIAKRDGNEIIPSIEGLLGNTALLRMLAVDEQFAEDLKTHAIEEMTTLGKLLPTIYPKTRP